MECGGQHGNPGGKSRSSRQGAVLPIDDFVSMRRCSSEGKAGRREGIQEVFVASWSVVRTHTRPH